MGRGGLEGCNEELRRPGRLRFQHELAVVLAAATTHPCRPQPGCERSIPRPGRSKGEAEMTSEWPFATDSRDTCAVYDFTHSHIDILISLHKREWLWPEVTRWLEPTGAAAPSSRFLLPAHTSSELQTSTTIQTRS